MPLTAQHLLLFCDGQIRTPQPCSPPPLVLDSISTGAPLLHLYHRHSPAKIMPLVFLLKMSPKFELKFRFSLSIPFSLHHRNFLLWHPAGL